MTTPNVIGYKDTPDERLANWRTMIFIRDSVRESKKLVDQVENKDKFSKALNKEKELYDYFLSNYVKKAA